MICPDNVKALNGFYLCKEGAVLFRSMRFLLYRVYKGQAFWGSWDSFFVGHMIFVLALSVDFLRYAERK